MVHRFSRYSIFVSMVLLSFVTIAAIHTLLTAVYSDWNVSDVFAPLFAESPTLGPVEIEPSFPILVVYPEEWSARLGIMPVEPGAGVPVSVIEAEEGRRSGVRDHGFIVGQI